MQVLVSHKTTCRYNSMDHMRSCEGASIAFSSLNVDQLDGASAAPDSRTVQDAIHSALEALIQTLTYTINPMSSPYLTSKAMEQLHTCFMPSALAPGSKVEGLPHSQLRLMKIVLVHIRCGMHCPELVKPLSIVGDVPSGGDATAVVQSAC